MKLTGLAAVAKQLGLRARERRFAELFTKDPDRNQTQAAIAAGYSATSAHVRASELVRNRKVQAYMAALLEVARVQAPELAKTLPEYAPDEAAMSTAEVLLRLSRMGRSDIGAHLAFNAAGEATIVLDKARTDTIREYTVEESRDPSDVEKRRTIMRTKLKVADPVPALLGLARIYGLEDRGADDDEMRRVVNMRAFIVNVVMRDGRARAALSELSRHVLEAKAKVVPA